MANEFKKVFDDIRDAVNTLDLKSLPEIAEFLRSRIVAKARTGKRAKSDGSEDSIPALKSETYIAYRKNLAAGVRAAKKSGKAPPKVSEFFSPTRSNLTLTGQYLESIQVTNIDQAKSEITIGPTGQREDGKLGNAELAEYLSKERSIFDGVDKTAKSRVIAMVRADIRNKIRENLSKK